MALGIMTHTILKSIGRDRSMERVMLDIEAES